MTNKFLDYYQRPIFLHPINKELHDALNRGANLNQLLDAIRTFSVVSGQVMFCNISQIYDLLFEQDDILTELIELERAGRFVAHSEFSSFGEFRESKIRGFPNTIGRRPGFIEQPSKTLLRLPFGFIGKGFSTTQFIESSLRAWLNGQPNRLQAQLSDEDRRVLRRQEEWIGGTLHSREHWALTFDAFETTAPKSFATSDEQAIRRALSQIYINGYEESFSAVTIWGLRGINHFEKGALPCGMHYGLAKFVLEQSGIESFLRSRKHYGRMHRLTGETGGEKALFRESFVDFAIAIDESLTGVTAWHERHARIQSIIQSVSANKVILNVHSLSTLNDLLGSAAEKLVSASGFVRTGRSASGGLGISDGRKLIAVDGLQKLSGDGSSIVIKKCSAASNDVATSQSAGPAPYRRYGFFSIVVGIAVAALSYIGLHWLAPMASDLRLFVSLLVGIFGAMLFLYFHPDFWFRRFAFSGLCITVYGGSGLYLSASGSAAFGSGDLFLGRQDSVALIMVGGLITVVSLILEHLNRRSGSRGD